jgi:hypothetical protein
MIPVAYSPPRTPLHAPRADFIFYPVKLKLHDVDGTSMLTVSEAADSSLGYDLGIKSRLDAAFGVAEYCVIGVNSSQIHVPLDPAGDTSEVIDIEPRNSHLGATFGIPFRLADLDLGRE